MLKYKLRLLKNHDYCILLIGQFISNLGTGINSIGVTLFMIKFEQPIIGVGIVTILQTIPWIIFCTGHMAIFRYCIVNGNM